LIEQKAEGRGQRQRAGGRGQEAEGRRQRAEEKGCAKFRVGTLVLQITLCQDNPPRSPTLSFKICRQLRIDRLQLEGFGIERLIQSFQPLFMLRMGRILQNFQGF